jgi:hypothetical protein
MARELSNDIKRALERQLSSQGSSSEPGEMLNAGETGLSRLHLSEEETKTIITEVKNERRDKQVKQQVSGELSKSSL